MRHLSPNYSVLSIHLPYTDNELLQQLAEGNEEAFKQFYNQHWNRIYSLALAYLKSATQAQDIVQEVFIKVWTRRGQLKNVEKPEAFVYIMGRNEVVNALKKKVTLASIDEQQNDYLPDDYLLPHQAVDLKEMQEKINRAIDTLPPQQKLIFKLSREEGLNHEQIADRLGIERATVKNHIVRALNTLRQLLKVEKNSLVFWWLLAEWFEQTGHALSLP